MKKEHEYGVLNYKYNHTNESYYYNYLQSPFCDWLVSFFPRFLAPNLITFSGFLLNIYALVSMFYLYGNDNEGPVDNSFIWTMVWTWNIYNTLDNIDGKQARRTGSGSPMGMLFDHGCDATTAILCNLMMQRICQFGNTSFGVLIMGLSLIPFYYINLEPFFTGKMVIPAWTGPEDASLYYTIICIYTGYMGAVDLWAGEVEYGFYNGRYVHLVACVVFSLEVLSVVGSTLLKLWGLRNDKRFIQNYSFVTFIAQCSFMLVLQAVWMAYVSVPGNEATFEKHLRLCQFAFGGQYLQATFRLLVANITNDKFMPYRRTHFLTWALMFVNAASIYFNNGQALMDTQNMLIFINVVTWLAVAHLTYFTLYEMKSLLKIKIFTITPKAKST